MKWKDIHLHIAGSNVIFLYIIFRRWEEKTALIRWLNDTFNRLTSNGAIFSRDALSRCQKAEKQLKICRVLGRPEPREVCIYVCVITYAFTRPSTSFFLRVFASTATVAAEERLSFPLLYHVARREKERRLRGVSAMSVAEFQPR